MRALCTLDEFDIFVGDTCAWWVEGLNVLKRQRNEIIKEH